MVFVDYDMIINTQFYTKISFARVPCFILVRIYTAVDHLSRKFCVVMAVSPLLQVYMNIRVILGILQQRRNRQNDYS